ncbi:Small secreted domain [Actinacidiphila rubida]|uniref:Small secreted domain n=1 Tax=Actinacidiphila rubida TaxID=310780 RepID=A0A1H8GS90_9ACTN|nr:Small secreted domain [Actinacidiphila rubida]
MKLMHKSVALAVLAGGIILVSGGVATADSGANGAAVGSPGVLSGDVIEVPINIPVNLCGDSVDVIGLLNPALGDTCVND